tara:strand:+ start:286 stop:516 length:231 start_codon:yes stop_codon:yes gene_type:complete
MSSFIGQTFELNDKKHIIINETWHIGKKNARFVVFKPSLDVTKYVAFGRFEKKDFFNEIHAGNIKLLGFRPFIKLK